MLSQCILYKEESVAGSEVEVICATRGSVSFACTVKAFVLKQRGERHAIDLRLCWRLLRISQQSAQDLDEFCKKCDDAAVSRRDR
jgi:hypothetical protein